MKTRVVNVRREPCEVPVHRPTKWGNPFSHQDDTLAPYHVATREAAVANYEEWIKAQPHLLAALPELRGRVLGCFCHPLPCHAHVLARLADAAGEE